MMINIEILLSTYNGESYLRELLESILNQSATDWRLLIRDDYSHDKTRQIINAYHHQYPDKILLIEDDKGHLGPAASFNRLMAASSAPYIMFCDQDDVWLKDKVQQSLNAMIGLEAQFGKDSPLAVYTDSVGVDQDLKVKINSVQQHIGVSAAVNTRLRNIVLMNVIFGNTLMMNRPLLALSFPVPVGAYMHDWWVSLVVASFGHIAYLPQATLLYRQHGGNTCGLKKMTIFHFLKITSFFRHQQRVMGQIKAFDQRFKGVIPKMKKDLSKDLFMLFQYANLNELSFWKRKVFLFQFYQGFPYRLKALADIMCL